MFRAERSSRFLKRCISEVCSCGPTKALYDCAKFFLTGRVSLFHQGSEFVYDQSSQGGNIVLVGSGKDVNVKHQVFNQRRQRKTGSIQIIIRETIDVSYHSKDGFGVVVFVIKADFSA